MPIPSKSSEDLAKLADDYVAEKIFCDRHLADDPGMIQSVFMPLLFLEQAQLDEFRAEPPGMFYEHISEASPRTVNGYPVFMSVQYLSKEDFAKFRDIVKALQAAKDKVLASYAKPGDSTPS